MLTRENDFHLGLFWTTSRWQEVQEITNCGVFKNTDLAKPVLPSLLKMSPILLKLGMIALKTLYIKSFSKFLISVLKAVILAPKVQGVYAKFLITFELLPHQHPINGNWYPKLFTGGYMKKNRHKLTIFETRHSRMLLRYLKLSVLALFDPTNLPYANQNFNMKTSRHELNFARLKDLLGPIYQPMLVLSPLGQHTIVASPLSTGLCFKKGAFFHFHASSHPQSSSAAVLLFKLKQHAMPI